MLPDACHVLLKKGQDDERLALVVVGNAAILDEQIGFLAQQAIEKAVKAVLSYHRAPFRRTHDLSELLDLLKSHNIGFPSELESSVALTPFATQMRYDYLPSEADDEHALDRPTLMRLVRTALHWAEGVCAPSDRELPGSA